MLDARHHHRHRNRRGHEIKRTITSVDEDQDEKNERQKKIPKRRLPTMQRAYRGQQRKIDKNHVNTRGPAL